ncbi:formate dehydrogenase subunit gamma [Magnetospirillum sp. 15-1]|uniref:formate dehydrogenase subunit gamma n=1 Tax=Magnetospirillum sp. 15-1 TaxID=1979370 RepID=UPI000BBBE6C4|nr:formate dehydrogenase subunit gamma [Magnetospirillum sp. 15-1]
MTTHHSPDLAAVDAIVDELKAEPGALLPILHAIQDRLGHIPAGAIPAIATALNRSAAEVHGVVSFYHHFRTEPAGASVLHLCRAEACQARGADALAEHAAGVLGCGFHETTADGAVTLEAAFCLGLCASGPAALVNGGEPHARLTPARLDALIAGMRGAR